MRRGEIPAAEAERAARALRDRVIACDLIVAGAAVSGFWPIGDEIDPRPLMRALAARGHALCLPVTLARGQPLLFRRWQEGDELVAAGFGTFVPKPEAPPLRPDVLLVPLLAFDHRGSRLGYGVGYYDRTLTALRGAGPRIMAIGVGFAAQEVTEVPAGPGDQRLDAIATEREIIACQGSV